MRLATYNIGTQSVDSLQGKLKQRFEDKSRNDPHTLSVVADIVYILDISEGWAGFVASETGWATTWLATKALCRRPVMSKTHHRWERLPPESSISPSLIVTFASEGTNNRAHFGCAWSGGGILSRFRRRIVLDGRRHIMSINHQCAMCACFLAMG